MAVAAQELERCVKQMGFSGAMISGHYHDLPYDDEPHFDLYQPVKIDETVPVEEQMRLSRST